MIRIIKNPAPAKEEVELFLSQINFKIPDGLMDFLRESNGADINADDEYVIVWRLTELVELNESYQVEEFAPDYYIFGSNGGGTAFLFNKSSGYIYQTPFIGMAEELDFRANTFTEFIETL